MFGEKKITSQQQENWAKKVNITEMTEHFNSHNCTNSIIGSVPSFCPLFFFLKSQKEEKVAKDQ